MSYECSSYRFSSVDLFQEWYRHVAAAVITPVTDTAAAPAAASETETENEKGKEKENSKTTPTKRPKPRASAPEAPVSKGSRGKRACNMCRWQSLVLKFLEKQ